MFSVRHVTLWGLSIQKRIRVRERAFKNKVRVRGMRLQKQRQYWRNVPIKTELGLRE